MQEGRQSSAIDGGILVLVRKNSFNHVKNWGKILVVFFNNLSPSNIAIPSFMISFGPRKHEICISALFASNGTKLTSHCQESFSLGKRYIIVLKLLIQFPFPFLMTGELDGLPFQTKMIRQTS